MTATAKPLTATRLRECPDCGLMQEVPGLAPRQAARCLRCHRVLRRAWLDPLGNALALTLAGLALLGIGANATLLSVSALGAVHRANLFSGPVGLSRHGVWELSVVVLFTTVVAPAVKLTAMTWVLAPLRLRGVAWPGARKLFEWTQHLRPWSMIEVYLLGSFVAIVRLSSLLQIELGPALYALGGLMLMMVAADAVLDPQAVWEALDEADGIRRPDPPPVADAVGCDICGLVSHAARNSHCPRCGSALHARKVDSVNRALALSVASIVLYVPANLLPVLTVVQLGRSMPSTILGGAEELLKAGEWPLALLVFFASVLVPVLKLVGLGVMLWATQSTVRTGRGLRDRTRLFRIVHGVGRWSMIDIFMESILVALVQFGVFETIDPNAGAVAFAGVVVLTMLAAESFDPRLMWDRAAQRGRA